MFNSLNPRIVTQAPNHIFFHNTNTRELEILPQLPSLKNPLNISSFTLQEPPLQEKKSSLHLDVETMVLREKRKGICTQNGEGREETRRGRRELGVWGRTCEFWEVGGRRMERVWGRKTVVGLIEWRERVFCIVVLCFRETLEF